jgi:hypothetical protein
MVFFRTLARDLAALVSRLARAPVAWLALAAVVLEPRLYAIWRARRRRRRAAWIDDAAAVPAELRALVRDVERRWRALGRPRQAARGLLEHARALCSDTASAAPVPAPLAAACLEIVETYYRARFGGQAPDTEELTRLRR